MNLQSSILIFQELLYCPCYGAEAKIGGTDIAERHPADGIHIVASPKGSPLGQRAAEETVGRRHHNVTPRIAIGDREEVADGGRRTTQLLGQLALESLLERLVRVNESPGEVQRAPRGLLRPTADQQLTLIVDDECRHGSRCILEQLETAVGTTARAFAAHVKPSAAAQRAVAIAVQKVKRFVSQRE